MDIVYAPFLERHQIFFQDVWSYDIRSGRPKIAAFIEVCNELDSLLIQFSNQNHEKRFGVEHNIGHNILFVWESGNGHGEKHASALLGLLLEKL